jgi:hypothetical protein
MSDGLPFTGTTHSIAGDASKIEKNELNLQ